MFSDLGLEYANGAYYYVTGINYGYSDSETMLNNLKKYIESHNHIVIGPDTEGTLRLSSIINKNPGLPADVKAFSYPNIVSFDAVKIGRNELFVACPPSQLNNPEVTEGSRPYCVPALCLWYSHSQYVGRRIRGQSV